MPLRKSVSRSIFMPVFALGLAVAPMTPMFAWAADDAREGKVITGERCHFNRAEKIAMVSWIFPIAGAVITGLACKRDLFQGEG